jgi:hypothetical protein
MTELLGNAGEMDELTEHEARAFVGPRADRYLEQWRPLLTAAGSDSGGAGFNWSAFFFSGLWLPYRKMYKVAAIFFGVILLEALFEELIFVGVLGWPAAPDAVGSAVGLIASIVCGKLGNRWYLDHTRAKVAEVRDQGVADDRCLQTLAERGGTSVAASLGFIVVFFLLVAALLLASELVFAAS